MVLAGVCVRSVLLVVRVHVRVLCEWGFPRSALASSLACACAMHLLCRDAGFQHDDFWSAYCNGVVACSCACVCGREFVVA